MSQAGVVNSKGGGGGSNVQTLTGNTGGAVPPTANNINVIGAQGITVTGTPGTSTLTITPFGNYTNVTHAMSPYTVLATDYYISVDCSGGVVTLNFPNAPTALQTWVIKDRTGNSSLNHISITTPGGTVTIDGQTTYTMASNYSSIELLANATPTYEVF